LLEQGPKHNEYSQAKFVSAMGALFNFIHVHDPADPDAASQLAEVEVERGTTHVLNPDHLGGNITAAERQEANERRDRIALAMWDNYRHVLDEQGDE
jgi:site-specific recombinase XerD